MYELQNSNETHSRQLLGIGPIRNNPVGNTNIYNNAAMRYISLPHTCIIISKHTGEQKAARHHKIDKHRAILFWHGQSTDRQN